MPTWTTVPLWTVGQKLKAITLNLAVTAIGELQAWATTADGRIGSLESYVGTTSTRPQLRVYAPASVTVSSIVPYANVRKDTHGPYTGAGTYGWDSTNHRYYIPVSGFYHFDVAYKCSATAAAPSQYVAVNGSSCLSGPNAVSASYVGSSLAGFMDLVQGDIIDVREQSATYTPQNDATGSQGTSSNFLHVTYIGPTT